MQPRISTQAVQTLLNISTTPSLPLSSENQESSAVEPQPALDFASDIPGSPTSSQNATVFEDQSAQPKSQVSSVQSISQTPEASTSIAFASPEPLPFMDFSNDQGDHDQDNDTQSSLFILDNMNGTSELATGSATIFGGLNLSSTTSHLGGFSLVEPFPTFVPDRLYCPMPWPDDMLASPERRFLWQYFLSIAEADFLCLDWEDVGHFYGFQHPYITTMPHMALSSDSLRGAIFCFAAAQYQMREGRGDFEKTKAIAGSEAALALRTAITPGTDDNNVLARISAATLLHYFGTERHDYLLVASRLAGHFLSRPKNESSLAKTFTEVSLTEFRWSVVSTLCSLQYPSAPIGDRLCRLIEMSEAEIKQNYSTAFQRWVSHPIYSFSPRLVNPLLRIGRLLESQLVQLENLDVQPDTSWTTKFSDAEEMLLRARELDVNASKSTIGSADPMAVVALNESMYAAGAILLYARIHGLPPTVPFIRRQTNIVIDEIAKIPGNSRVSFAIVFPLFIAGCETIEEHLRKSILERLRQPGGITYNRGDLVGALKHIWQIRDLDPGLPWPHWVNKVDPEYRISCLM